MTWEKGHGFRTFWIEKPWLMVGAHPFDSNIESGKLKLNQIMEDGIRYFINLTEVGEVNNLAQPLVDYSVYGKEIAKQKGYDVIFDRFPIPDGGYPSDKTLQEILTRLRINQQQKIGTYFHCWGGRGRTATVLTAWLFQNPEFTPSHIQRYLESQQNFDPEPWKCDVHGGPVIETSVQWDFIQEWIQKRE